MSKPVSADNPQAPTFRCVARRHMDAEFRLYDAMLAICKRYQKLGEPLPSCYAKMTTLANMIDRSTEQVRVMLKKLEDAGWVEDLQPGRQWAELCCLHWYMIVLALSGSRTSRTIRDN